MKAIAGHLSKYILIGLVTIVPIVVTWLLLAFIFDKLADIGRPIAREFFYYLDRDWPLFADMMAVPWFQKLIGVLSVFLLLYLCGWFATRVIGRRLVGLLEATLLRIPLVKSIYSPIKQLLQVVQKKTPDVQRVVLIDFPSPEMKTVGLATRTLVDEDTGAKLVAVYVPTTPNPTSGYLEIVPMDRVINTDWSVEEAMKFIVSGGIVGRDSINYGHAAD